MKKIKLTQGKYALVDDEDYEIVKPFTWHYSNYGKTGYARTIIKGTKKGLRMHHLILPFTKGMMVDHINMDGIDNRRKNLRLVTKSQNMMNSGIRINNKSGYKGVCWDNGVGKWLVTIWFQNKQIWLGHFEDKKEAARVYNQAAREYHKEFALLNKIV